MNFYGLKTCETCRKARKALDAKGVEYAYHDVRDDGVTKTQIAKWAKAVGWEKLLNKSSTTWRGLSDADKTNIDEKKAVALMAANPTLIKRPIIENRSTRVFVGWTEETKLTLLR